MKNFIQPGQNLTLAAPAGGVSSGGLVIVGKLVGVASTDAAAGSPVAVATEGVYELPKDATTAVAAGDALYWDVADGEINKSAAGNILIGYAVQAAVTAAATVRVRLIPTAV